MTLWKLFTQVLLISNWEEGEDMWSIVHNTGCSPPAQNLDMEMSTTSVSHRAETVTLTGFNLPYLLTFWVMI